MLPRLLHDLISPQSTQLKYASSTHTINMLFLCFVVMRMYLPLQEVKQELEEDEDDDIDLFGSDDEVRKPSVARMFSVTCVVIFGVG